MPKAIAILKEVSKSKGVRGTYASMKSIARVHLKRRPTEEETKQIAFAMKMHRRLNPPLMSKPEEWNDKMMVRSSIKKRNEETRLAATRGLIARGRIKLGLQASNTKAGKRSRKRKR